MAAKVQWLELAGSWPHHVLGAQRARVRDGLIRFIGGSCWFYICLLLSVHVLFIFVLILIFFSYYTLFLGIYRVY